VIETKQTDVNQTLKKVEAARTVSLREQEKNNYLKKQSAALEAKLNFIEKTYDYSTVAK
jgi:BMFP domain-containing protein YqiC